jgi:hypothetical protein
MGAFPAERRAREHNPFLPLLSTYVFYLNGEALPPDPDPDFPILI